MEEKKRLGLNNVLNAGNNMGNGGKTLVRGAWDGRCDELFGV